MTHEFFPAPSGRNSRLDGFYVAQINRAAEDLLDALRDMNRDYPNGMTSRQIELLNLVGVYVRSEKARKLNLEVAP